MSQSQSHGKRARERAVTHDSTSSSQHSVQDIEDDIDALIQEVDQLGREFIASTEEYNSSLSKARYTHNNTRSRIYTQSLAKLQEISMKTKREDMKKQAYVELTTAAQNKLDDIKGRIDNRASEFEAEGSEISKAKRRAPRGVAIRAKANEIRGNTDEIKKVAGTPEGLEEIKQCKARLADAYVLVQRKLWNSYQQYLAAMDDLTRKHEKIKETLDNKNIPEVPGDHAEAAETVNNLGSWDPSAYEENIERKNRDDKRMKLLEK